MLNNLRALHQVMRDTKLPRPELESVVHRRLRDALVSAYLRVPYYRKVMQSAGYNPIQEYRGPEDLSRLPITTKETLKQGRVESFVEKGSDLSRCFSESTSGSTGIPLRVYRAPYERAVQIAKWLRVLFVNGYSVRHKVMSPVSPSRLTEGCSIIQRFGFLRRLAIDYVHHSVQEMVDLFLDYKPDLLYGNRSHLELMALELKRRRIRYNGLKLLVGAAEVIHDSSRRLCRKHFGVELVETYGSVEMGVMAYETSTHDGLHLCEDLTYFEFLDKEGKPVPPGEPGKVIVTDLMGGLMPFIRYDQGDFAVFEYRDGTDGNPQRTLAQIIGRDNDYALLADGTRLPPHDLYKVIAKYEDIAQFRIIQKGQSLFHILIVGDTSYFLSIRDDLIHRLQEKFPPTVGFEVFQVERIEPDSHGKIRTFVSEIET